MTRTLRRTLQQAVPRLIQDGMTREEAALWLTMEQRELFAKTCITDATGKPWQVRDYQRDSLESRALRKVHCDGRDVGKSAEIEIMVCWAMLTRPNSEMLVATQTENHLFPLMNRLVRRFQCDPVFAPALVEIKRSPSWYFRFRNGFVLWGRIAGPRGINFQGMHVDWQIIDEAQEMTETAWGELFQALNGGGRRWIYGVPNGLRNTFHRMTQMADTEQYNWPSTLNPDFSAEKDEELQRLYGGMESPGYIHRVLGQHGAPTSAVFNLDDYLRCVDPGLGQVEIHLKEGDDFAAPMDVPGRDYYLGCDLGYARDPSEFVIYQSVSPHLVNILRIHLVGVNYARQLGIIQALDAAYDFRGIGIDSGNSGRAVAHQLMALGETWCDKVRAFEFGSRIDLPPLPDGQPQRRRIKEFMTELLQRRMAEGTIVFPPLADRESQYAAHTYTTNALGQVIYDKGNDHIIDADRCAVLRHYLDTEDESEGIARGVAVLGF